MAEPPSLFDHPSLVPRFASSPRRDPFWVVIAYARGALGVSFHLRARRSRP